MQPMTRPRTLRRLALGTALLTTLVLGACGSDAKPQDGVGKTSVEIVDFNFKPEALQVKVGTKVTFTNKDSFDHTVTAKDKSFDSGNLAKDATFEQTFDKAGTYEYLCNIHNSMTGSVVVS